MGRFLVLVVAIAVIAIVVFVVLTVVDCVRSSHRAKIERRRREEEARIKAIESGTGFVSGKPKKSKKKDKKHKGAAIDSVGVGELSAKDWFSISYPSIATHPRGKGSVMGEAWEALAAQAAEERAISRFSSMLPRRYRGNLDTISARISQISDKTDDPYVLSTLESYRESVEKSTLNYVELAGAPVRSPSIVEAMNEIEEAVAAVPAALDSILASCYDKSSMSALIEAGSLKAVVEHNKMMFGGVGGNGAPWERGGAEKESDDVMESDSYDETRSDDKKRSCECIDSSRKRRHKRK